MYLMPLQQICQLIHHPIRVLIRIWYRLEPYLERLHHLAYLLRLPRLQIQIQQLQVRLIKFVCRSVFILCCIFDIIQMRIIRWIINLNIWFGQQWVLLCDFGLLNFEEYHAGVLVVLDRFLNLVALKIPIGKLTVKLSGFVVCWAIMTLMNLQRSMQTRARFIRHICSLLGKGEENILISDLIVELREHLRLI